MLRRSGGYQSLQQMALGSCFAEAFVYGNLQEAYVFILGQASTVYHAAGGNYMANTGP